MEMANLGDEPMFDGIDLDRVIVDPDYRRRVMDRLRAEAATRSTPADIKPAASPRRND